MGEKDRVGREKESERAGDRMYGRERERERESGERLKTRERVGDKMYGRERESGRRRERVNITNDVITDDPRPTTARVVLKRPLSNPMPRTQRNKLEMYFSGSCISSRGSTSSIRGSCMRQQQGQLQGSMSSCMGHVWLLTVLSGFGMRHATFG